MKNAKSYSIAGQSLNEIELIAIQAVLTHGSPVGSRADQAIELTNITKILADPAARHLYLHERTNNFKAALA